MSLPHPNFAPPTTSHAWYAVEQGSDPTASGQAPQPLPHGTEEETEAGGGQSDGSEPAGLRGGTRTRARTQRDPVQGASIPTLPQGSQLASGDSNAAARGLSSLRPPYKAASGKLGRCRPWSQRRLFPRGAEPGAHRTDTVLGPADQPHPKPPLQRQGKSRDLVRGQGRTHPEPERSRGD